MGWLLHAALLSIAFGCGIPALLYFLTQGRKSATEDKAAVKMEAATAELKAEINRDVQKLGELDLDYSKIYDRVAIKGYCYIPKPQLRMLVQQLVDEHLELRRRLETRMEKPAPSAEHGEKRLSVRRG